MPRDLYIHLAIGNVIDGLAVRRRAAQISASARCSEGPGHQEQASEHVFG
jgi:hypothetical protein